jgi:hypothetical protein
MNRLAAFLPYSLRPTKLEVARMDAKFDIFKRLPDGQPLWVRAVEGLEEAKRQLIQMALASPGDYFIYNTRSGEVIAG